jgi:integrase/recombinase XerD
VSGFFRKGKTIYLANGGTLEKAQLMAGHADPRTTKLYDRTSNAVSLDEVEQVAF